MSYWQITEEDIYGVLGVEPHMTASDLDYLLPDDVPATDETRQVYFNTLTSDENLGNLESAIERVLDDSRYAAESAIGDYLITKGVDPVDVEHLLWYKNMADDFAHETLFALKGGDPEYNEIHLTYAPEMFKYLEEEEDPNFLTAVADQVLQVGAKTYEEWVDSTRKEIFEEAAKDAKEHRSVWTEDQWREAMDNGVVLYYEPHDNTYTVFFEGSQVEDGITSYKQAEDLAKKLIGGVDPEDSIFYYNEEGTDVAQDYYQEYEKQFVWTPLPKPDPRQQTLPFQAAAKSYRGTPKYAQPPRDDEEVDELTEAVARRIIPKLELEYWNWFDTPAGDHYDDEFVRLIDSWFVNIAEAVIDARSTGDVTSLDYHDTPQQLAEILFKLSPDWENPGEQKRIYNNLKELEDEAVNFAFSKMG